MILFVFKVEKKVFKEKGSPDPHKDRVSVKLISGQEAKPGPLQRSECSAPGAVWPC